jgi:hypothetical protein
MGKVIRNRNSKGPKRWLRSHKEKYKQNKAGKDRNMPTKNRVWKSPNTKSCRMQTKQKKPQTLLRKQTHTTSKESSYARKTRSEKHTIQREAKNRRNIAPTINKITFTHPKEKAQQLPSLG